MTGEVDAVEKTDPSRTKGPSHDVGVSRLWSPEWDTRVKGRSPGDLREVGVVHSSLGTEEGIGPASSEVAVPGCDG